MPDPFGLLNVHKPLGLSSHDVVARVRRGLHLSKVGHAGTLDPLATGVLVLGVGAATRLTEYAMAGTKRYHARVRLGTRTTTYDAEGDVVASTDASHISQEAVAAALGTFVGDVDQLPPMYSAVKQGGKKLYDLARAGQEVARTPRRVHIASIAVLAWQPPDVLLDVVCSSGTYIRSLADDVGTHLGVGAYLAGLVRVASGAFTLDDAVPLDALLADAHWSRWLLPPQLALQGFPVVLVDGDGARTLAQGKPLPAAGTAPDGALAQARYTDVDGALVAVLRAEHSLWYPHKVFWATA